MEQPNTAVLSADQMAAIFDVTPEQVKGCVDSTAGLATIPAEWWKSGRRRLREAEAAIGRQDFMAAVDYLVAGAA